jgi:hypothetical protein
MNSLLHNISLKKLLTSQDLTATTNGTGVDMKAGSPENFDAMLAIVNVGAITGTPTSVKVKIEESDTIGSSYGVADGGTEITVVQNTEYSFQITRTKQYIRITVTIDGGTSPHVIIGAAGIATNWAKPLPIV